MGADPSYRRTPEWSRRGRTPREMASASRFHADAPRGRKPEREHTRRRLALAAGNGAASEARGAKLNHARRACRSGGAAPDGDRTLAFQIIGIGFTMLFLAPFSSAGRPGGVTAGARVTSPVVARPRVATQRRHRTAA